MVLLNLATGSTLAINVGWREEVRHMTGKKKQTEAATPDTSQEDELAKLEKTANEEAEKLRAEGDETPSSESAPDNQTPSEEETPPDGSDDGGEQSPESDESPGEEESDEGNIKNLSPKAQKRFKKLNERAKEAEVLRLENERLKALNERLQTPPLDLSKPNAKLPWEPEKETYADGTPLTEEELQQRIQKGVRQGIVAEKQVDTFSSDIASVEKDYPTLNAEGENFDKPLATKISSLYEQVAMVRTKTGVLVFKPNAPTFRAFVDEIMGIRAKAAESGKKEVTGKLVKRAARQPISPSGATPPSGSKGVRAKIMDPNVSLEDAEAIANKAAKRG